MAKVMKPYGCNVKLNVSDEGVLKDHIHIILFKRILDADNEEIGNRKFYPNECPEGMQRMFSLYGLSKLAQDRTSDESGEEGRLDSMDAVFARFVEGSWEKERESTGRSVRIEVEALAKLKNVEVGTIQKALRDYDAEAREKILSSKAVQDVVAEMQKAAEEAPEVDLALGALVEETEGATA